MKIGILYNLHFNHNNYLETTEKQNYKLKCSMHDIACVVRVPKCVFYLKDGRKLKKNVKKKVVTKHVIILCILYSLTLVVNPIV